MNEFSWPERHFDLPLDGVHLLARHSFHQRPSSSGPADSAARMPTTCSRKTGQRFLAARHTTSQSIPKYAWTRMLRKFDAHQEDILAWFNQRARGSAEPDAPIQTVIEVRDVLQEHRHAIQSQAMGGFNEALLMQQQVLHFDPVDPLGFAEYRKFSEIIVRAAVKGHAHTAPLPHFEHFDFHPIRTGEMRLQRVRLVDSFGRPADLPATLHTTQQLYSERDGHVSLPPPITQPAPVNFRR